MNTAFFVGYAAALTAAPGMWSLVRGIAVVSRLA